jgi:DNA-binding winged helix-turn-helix (wHTH) protein/TolB-like protein
MGVEARQAPIDLAHEAAFALGGLEVRPAKLEVATGERREVLEPRIMQVLVALARQRGEVVSRDDLIESCWAGRVVGEDSINRCIFRLRRLAEELGGFSLQTIPRVGYRLTEVGEAGRPAPPGPRRWIIAGCVLVLLIAAAAGVWVLRRTLVVEAAMSEPPSVAVLPFAALDGDAAAKALSLKLTDQINGVLEESSIASVPATSARAASADLLIRGTVSHAGDSWRVRVYLVDRPADLVLLSHEFTGAADHELALRDEVSHRLVETVYTALEPRQQPGLKIDAQTLALYVTATDGHKYGDPAGQVHVRQLFERVVQRAPDFGAARAKLAFMLMGPGNSPEEAQAQYRRAVQEAKRAAEYGPYAMGVAADPLYLIARGAHPTEVAAAEDNMLKAIAAGTEFPFVIAHECGLLVELGRATDALPHCEKAMALRPLAGATGWRYAAALAAAGRLSEARKVADTAQRYIPLSETPRQVAFDIEAFQGSLNAAHEILHAPPPAPPIGSPALVAALDAYLTARKSGSRAAGDRAINSLRALGKDETPLRYLVLTSASLGRLDDAFAALAAPEINHDPVGAAILLDPAAASLRGDPRFWQVAARLGYVAYWRTRNRWPDFCSAPGNTIDCPRMAAQALPKG